jgi:hypothetical protein
MVHPTNSRLRRALAAGAMATATLAAQLVTAAAAHADDNCDDNKVNWHTGDKSLQGTQYWNGPREESSGSAFKTSPAGVHWTFNRAQRPGGITPWQHVSWGRDLVFKSDTQIQFVAGFEATDDRQGFSSSSAFIKRCETD